MALETGDYIADLVRGNPTGTDSKAQGDDHLRLVKKVLQQSFPNVTAPVIFANMLTTTSAVPAGNISTPQTAAELAASVTPTVLTWLPGDIRRYGAVGAVDCAAALNAALRQVAQVGGSAVRIPAGTWPLLTSPAVVAALTDATIFGDGADRSVLQLGATSLSALRFTGATARLRIGGISFRSLTPFVASVGISVTGTSAVIPARDITIEDCTFPDMVNSVLLTFVEGAALSRCRSRYTAPPAAAATCYQVDNCRSVVMSSSGINVNTFPNTGNGVSILDDCEDITLLAVSVRGMANAFQTQNVAGVVGPQRVRLNTCSSAGATARGYHLQNGRDCSLSNCAALDAGVSGIVIASGVGHLAVGCKVARSQQAGIDVAGGSDHGVIGSDATNNSQATSALHAGIRVNTPGVRVVGCRSGDYAETLTNKQSYGLAITSGVDRAVVEGCDFTGNATGEYQNLSTSVNNRIEQCLIGTAVYDPPLLNPNSGATTTVAVVGAKAGDRVECAWSGPGLRQSVELYGWVDSADVVSVRFFNGGSGVADLFSGTVKVRVRPA